MPYGYEPSDYRKNYGFVAGAANAIASGVIGLSEEQKRKEALELEYAKAEKLAAEKKELINYSYKTLRNLASRKMDKLIELGEIKPEEKSAMLKVLVQPDKFTNFKDYYQVNGTAFDELDKSLDEKLAKFEQQGLTEEVTEAQKPQPQFGPQEYGVTDTTESGFKKYEPSKFSEVIGNKPGAATKQQTAQAPGVAAIAPTSEELEAIPAFKYQASDADLAKQKKSEEDMRFKRERLDFDKNRENRLAKNDALGWANHYLNKEKFEQLQSSQMFKDMDGKLRLLVNADGASAETEGEIKELEEKVASNKQRLESNEAKLDPTLAESIESEISKQTGELSKKRDKLRGQIEKVIKYEDEYNKSTEALRKYAEKINEGSPTSKYTEAKVESVEGPVIGSPSPAPSPSGSGTPAPVIGGASPKLPPKDTTIAGTLPGSIKKPQTKAELIDWLKNVKKMPPDAIERYVAMQNQKGLFLK